MNDDPHDSMDTTDPFGAFSSLGGGLGLAGFGPQVRGGNTPFRSHSFNIGGLRSGGGPGLGQKVFINDEVPYKHYRNLRRYNHDILLFWAHLFERKSLQLHLIVKSYHYQSCGTRLKYAKEM